MIILPFLSFLTSQGYYYDYMTQAVCGSTLIDLNLNQQCCNGKVWHTFNETCCWSGTALTVVPSPGACVTVPA